jgi:hypothetical protein
VADRTAIEVVGALVNGCVAGLNALTPTLYDLDTRVTAVGTGLTFGRVGSILSPTVAGARRRRRPVPAM